MTAGVALVRGRNAKTGLPAPLTLSAGRHHTAATILRAWLQGKGPHTVRAYQHDLEDFALYLSRALGIVPTMTVDAALSRLFQQGSAAAHEMVLGFREWMLAANLSSASINRHLATLRSITKLGRMLGIAAWALEVPGVKAERRRQTAGPSVQDVCRMLEATRDDTEQGTRDYAIVLLMVCLGLRVSELCSLDLAHLDGEGSCAWIKGKGRRERELVPLPQPVLVALERYFRFRGTAAGPLFKTRGARGKHRDGRLETRSVLRIVRLLGQRVGLHVWCHALRHTAITVATEQSAHLGLSLDKVRAFSRHRDIRTLLLYVDDADQGRTQRRLTDAVANSVAPDLQAGGAL